MGFYDLITIDYPLYTTTGLQSLTFGAAFNQNLEGVTFPSGLHLTFGADFNQNLEDMPFHTICKA